MELSRIISVMCVFLLSVCLILSVYTVTVMRNTVNESQAIYLEMQSFLDDQEATEPQDNQLQSEEQETESSVPVDILADQFCMREVNGRIAIYSGDGYLIRILDIPVDTLPSADRLALRQGIQVSSWKEVLALMQDFGA